MMVKRCVGILFLFFALSCNQQTPAPLPIANFYVDNAQCTSPCYLHFYDQSYSAVSWHWDFGNGITSTYQNDSTQYGSPGFYNVTLSVWNADNVEDKITKQVGVF